MTEKKTTTAAGQPQAPAATPAPQTVTLDRALLMLIQTKQWMKQARNHCRGALKTLERVRLEPRAARLAPAAGAARACATEIMYLLTEIATTAGDISEHVVALTPNMPGFTPGADPFADPLMPDDPCE